MRTRWVITRLYVKYGIKDALRIEVSDFMNNWHERFT